MDSAYIVYIRLILTVKYRLTSSFNMFHTVLETNNIKCNTSNTSFEVKYIGTPLIDSSIKFNKIQYFLSLVLCLIRNISSAYNCKLYIKITAPDHVITKKNFFTFNVYLSSVNAFLCPARHILPC